MANNLRSWFRNQPTCVFYSVSAQEDNLGDIAIRLRMLDWLKESADSVIVYAGPMSEEYLQSFGFEETIDVVRSKSQVMFKLCRNLFRSRIFLVLPPGPSSFGGLRNSLRSLSTVAATLVLRASGGGVIQVGTAYRGGGPLSRRLQVFKTSLFQLCVVRDTNSIASHRSINAPDLAFQDWESTEKLERKRLTVSLRSDYEVDEKVLQQFKTIAADNGWTLTFVSQVRRDDIKHRELALKYSADVVSWEGSHGAQFNRVKTVYAESVAMLSDRLHGLIFSSNMGALPIALVHPGNDKLTSTFQSVIDVPRVIAGSGEIPSYVIDSIRTHEQNPEILRRDLQVSRMKLNEIRLLVLGALR